MWFGQNYTALHTPEDSTLYSYCCENLKSDIIEILLMETP
jgi:hypothetical protein